MGNDLPDLIQVATSRRAEMPQANPALGLQTGFFSTERTPITGSRVGTKLTFITCTGMGVKPFAGLFRYLQIVSGGNVVRRFNIAARSKKTGLSYASLSGDFCFHADVH
jgi:hypothetical protein